MKDQTIFRHEVLQLVDTGQSFDLEFITCDRTRGTGGGLKKVESWVKVKGDPADIRIPGKKLSRSRVTELKKAASGKIINIYNPSDPRDHIISVHWELMMVFNDKTIID